MFDIFFDIFAGHNNILKGIDPRAKFFVALATILAVVFSSNPILPLAVFTLCMIVALWIHIPIRLLLLRMVFPLGIVSVVVVLKTFMTGGESLYTFSFMGWILKVSQEGLRQGIVIGSRVLGAVGVVLLFGSVTPAHEIFRTLRWLKISPDWVEVAMLMYRYTFTLIDQAADIAAAQRCRLGYAGARRSLASMGTLAGSVLVSSYNQGIRTHEAMTARGYKGHMPFGPMPALSLKNKLIMFFALASVTGLYLILELKTW